MLFEVLRYGVGCLLFGGLESYRIRQSSFRGEHYIFLRTTRASTHSSPNKLRRCVSTIAIVLSDR
jgi:hypothetical protein